MVTSRLDELDLEYLVRDMEPFLIAPRQMERVLYFREAWHAFTKR